MSVAAFFNRNINSVAACAGLFPKTVADITALAEETKTRALTDLGKIVGPDCDFGTDHTGRTFANTAATSDFAESSFAVSLSVLALVKSTNTDKEMRDAAAKALVDVRAFHIDNFANNKELYKSLKALDATGLDADRSYWLKESILDYERRGMGLEGAEFEKVVALQKEIAELGTKFDTNISEDKSTILATKEELDGVPETIISGLKTEGEGDVMKYSLGMDYPTYFAVMKNCTVAATRERMFLTFESRAHPVNNDILHNIIRLRGELANLLGFKTYTEYDLSSKMAKTPEVAKGFVDGLIPGLQKKWALERAELFAEDQIHPSIKLSPEGHVQVYDVPFAMNEYKKTKLNVSETQIQEYFPMDSTVDALFKIYQSFFDITFEKCALPEGVTFWHEDVTVLAVKDNTDGGKLLGHCVLDLFPREGKYSHACCYGLMPAMLQKEEAGKQEFSPAVAVVLANFPAAQGDRPALLMHSDAVTFFHEFGHAIHGLMGRTTMATCAGTRVKRDFVELPSQMLENWLWDESILQMVTSHYKTKEPLPKELIQAKVKSKNAFSGRDALRQLQFATLSLRVFGDGYAAIKNEEDKSAFAANLIAEINPAVLDHVVYSDEQKFHCNFGHLIGYAATYYGYMWSDVYAQDVFEWVRSRDGLLDPKIGKRYIDCIIGRGGAEDPNELLKRFLEREPNQEAFLKGMGLAL